MCDGCASGARTWVVVGKSGGSAGIVDRYNLNWMVEVIWVRLEGHA